MTQKELIIAEIERLKKILEESTYYLDNSQQALGYSFALDDFKDFIDSLPEEKPSEDLEEAAEDCVWKSIDNNDPTLVPKFIPLLISLFVSGAYWQKEQMMKGAVEAEAEVCKLTERAWITPTDGKRFHQDVYDNFKAGDKVKIIIVKQ